MKSPLAKLKKELWVVFSKFIRKRDGGRCYTCNATGLKGSNYHAGHFIPKSVGGLALYFHEDNVWGQCFRCNVNLGGNQYIYGEKLGKRKVTELRKLQGKVTKWTEQDYQEKIIYYTQQLENYDRMDTR